MTSKCILTKMRFAINFIIIINILKDALCSSQDLQLSKERSVNMSKYNTLYTFPMKCQDRRLEASGPGFVAVYEGAVSRMFCRFAKEVSWMFAKSLNQTFTPVAQKDRVVIENSSLFIYRTKAEDAGVYRCQTSDKLSGLIILEVVDDAYTLVTNSTETPPISSQCLGQELTVYSVWSEWSECSVCGKTGRQRRFGMCYVKLNTSQFSAIPEGIPCRSRHLPDEIRNLNAVRNKNNEIIIRACKVQCKEKIFKLRSPTGAILETANNTAGIYSMAQHLPPQPPTPARDILYVGRGQRVLVKCPGTTLRDIPVIWRAGDLPVDPEVLRESSRGRVRVNALDHIVIGHALYEDANLYSCWEGENLSGTVKLAVWAGRPARWNHHTVLAALAVLGVLLLNIAMRMLFN